nr:hypothetical protein [uncultured Anaerocolumna sp.]
MTPEELNELKTVLKKEILIELKCEKRTNRIQGAELIRQKWMYGPDKKYRYSNSILDKAFGNKQHKIWDSIRPLLFAIFGKDNIYQLNTEDETLVEEVTDKLFQTVYDLRKLVDKKKNESDI